MLYTHIHHTSQGRRIWHEGLDMSPMRIVERSGEGGGGPVERECQSRGGSMVIVAQQQHPLFVVEKRLWAGRAHYKGPSEAIDLLIPRVPVPEICSGLLIHLPAHFPFFSRSTPVSERMLTTQQKSSKLDQFRGHQSEAEESAILPVLLENRHSKVV